MKIWGGGRLFAAIGLAVLPLALAACEAKAPPTVAELQQQGRLAWERPGSFQMLAVGKDDLGGERIEVLDTRTGQLFDCILGDKGSTVCTAGGKAVE